MFLNYCCPAWLPWLRFLSGAIQELTPYGLVNFYYVPRCAYDDGDESSGPGGLKWLKKYKFMCSGTWLKSAVLSCTCKAHRPLMDEVILPDGTVQRNGRRDELAQSGLYPPRLGQALVSAWQARRTATTTPSAPSGQVVKLPRTVPAKSRPAVKQNAVVRPGPAITKKRQLPSEKPDEDLDPWGSKTSFSSAAAADDVDLLPEPRLKGTRHQKKLDRHLEALANSSDDPWGSTSEAAFLDPDPWA